MWSMINNCLFNCEAWFIDVSSTLKCDLETCRQLWSLNYKRVVVYEEQLMNVVQFAKSNVYRVTKNVPNSTLSVCT